MTLNDRRFLHAIQEQHPITGKWFARAHETVYKAWTCDDCDSTVFVARLIKNGRGFFVAGVYRNLGKMEDPTDPTWVAHLEESRHLPPRRRSHGLSFLGGRHVNPAADVAVSKALDQLLAQNI
jgi:hypothetical protein